MSGAEVLGLISSIIAIIDVSLKVYNSVKDASGLPLAFRDVALRLPMVQITLQDALASLQKDGAYHGTAFQDRDDASIDTMKTSMETCKMKLEELETIFRNARPANDKWKPWEKIFNAIKTMSKSNRVLFLKNGIMEDLQVLTANRAVNAATSAQVTKLADNLGRANVNNSIGGSSFTIRNTGTGIQTVFSGRGNAHTRVEPLFSGVFHAPVNYTK